MKAFVLTLSLVSSAAFAGSHAVTIVQCQPLNPGNGIVGIFQVPANLPGDHTPFVTVQVGEAIFHSAGPQMFEGVRDQGSAISLNYNYAGAVFGPQTKFSVLVEKTLLVPGGVGQVMVSGVLDDQNQTAHTQIPYRGVARCQAVNPLSR